MPILDMYKSRRVYGKAKWMAALVIDGHRSADKRRHGCTVGLSLVMAIGLACVGLRADAAEDTPTETPYRLGDGLKVPGTGLTLGGYATGSFNRLDHAASRAAIDNASLFVWWEGDVRWKFFSELDYENALSTRDSSIKTEDRYLALERFYFDYALSETTSVRLGKFLTPIGRWNLVHATPLVWTSSRPLITTQTFPNNMTGVMVSGTIPYIGDGIDYSLYGASGSDIRPNPDQDTFNEALGGHLTVPLSADAQLGLSLAAFDQREVSKERKQLLGIDFFWSHKRFEISAEGVYRFSDEGSGRDEKGAFVQLVAPLSERLYAVGRFETYRHAQNTSETQRWLTGLNYRYTPAVVLKAEWVSSRHNTIAAPDGFMSSISILF